MGCYCYCNEDRQEIPRIVVMNKIDGINDFKPRIDKDFEGNINRVWLSAYTGRKRLLVLTGLVALISYSPYALT